MSPGTVLNSSIHLKQVNPVFLTLGLPDSNDFNKMIAEALQSGKGENVLEALLKNNYESVSFGRQFAYSKAQARLEIKKDDPYSSFA